MMRRGFLDVAQTHRGLLFRWAPSRFYGGGVVLGGVKKVSTSNETTYTDWTLHEATRAELRRVMPQVHPLTWEYLRGLHKKYQCLVALQNEGCRGDMRAEDVLRSAVKNKRTSLPFSLIKWQKQFQNEVDETAAVASTLEQLDASVSEYERLSSPSTEEGSTDGGEGTAAQLTDDQRKEMLELYSEEIDSEVQRLKESEDAIRQTVSRRVDSADVLGSSSRTWTVEVVGKAGGAEASLFAAELLDLLKMYATTAHEWRIASVVDEDSAGIASESTNKLQITGDGVYKHLRHEIGVHKVQRVPVTDHDGKMQTSTAVVTMMPILDPVSVDVQESDCTFDFVRGSGPGGQGMQSSSNCCVLTHRPSGISVKCHQTRSALGNKELAIQMVAQQILAQKVKAAQSCQDSAWASQWTSGERSEKMRTYNFPQNRVTDHRLGKDYPLVSFMDGAGPMLELHMRLNEADDQATTDKVLRQYLEGDFGSDLA